MSGGYHAIETASRDEITALQTERMKWSLRHTYENVPYFKAKCEAHGAHPDDFQSLGDLAGFPFTSKEDLRRNYPFGTFAVPMAQVVRVHASSGTTGKPTVVGYTREDIATWADVMARSIYAAGGRPGHKAHIAYGYGLFTGGLGAHYGAEKLGCVVIPISGGQTEKQVRLIHDFKPDLIMVTPSYMLNIGDEMRRQGMNPQETALRIGIFGAEPWTGEMRGELEDTFMIDALDIYGLSEVIGPGVAMECLESKDGPHIWEDHFYPEIVDPVSGAALADGEEGELVFTSLSKRAMPVIRYRTRDLTRLLPGTARAMRRMDKITGRSDDMLIIRGVNLFPSQIEELILRDKALAPHYQLEVSREGHMDAVKILVEARAGGAGAEARAAAGQALEHAIKVNVGISTRVIVQEPGAVARSEGKAQRVVDLRPKC